MRTDKPLDLAGSLEEMLERRGENGADVESIDREMITRFGVDRCILFTDLCGFTAYMRRNGIPASLHRLHRFKRLFGPVAEACGGRILKYEGDSVLAVFPDVEPAVTAVLEVNRLLDRHNRSMNPDEELAMCAGLGYGLVLETDEGDVFGDEVNLASKLGEDLAGAGELLLTEQARSRLSSDLGGRAYTLEALEEVNPWHTSIYRLF